MKFSSLVKIGFGFCIGYAVGIETYPRLMKKLDKVEDWVENDFPYKLENWLFGDNHPKTSKTISKERTIIDKTNSGRNARMTAAKVMKKSGSSNVEIAKRLGVSESTVRSYLK